MQKTQSRSYLSTKIKISNRVTIVFLFSVKLWNETYSHSFDDTESVHSMKRELQIGLSPYTHIRTPPTFAKTSGICRLLCLFQHHNGITAMFILARKFTLEFFPNCAFLIVCMMTFYSWFNLSHSIKRLFLTFPRNFSLNNNSEYLLLYFECFCFDVFLRFISLCVWQSIVSSKWHQLNEEHFVRNWNWM